MSCLGQRVDSAVRWTGHAPRYVGISLRIWGSIGVADVEKSPAPSFLLAGNFFERQLENRLRAIIHDDAAAVGRHALESFGRGDLEGASESVPDVRKLRTLVVEHGHATAPYVKVIAH